MNYAQTLREIFRWGNLAWVCGPNSYPAPWRRFTQRNIIKMHQQESANW